MPEFAACPHCGSTTATKVNFTWWGGILGPRLLNVVSCSGCGKQYNGKTGQSNTNAIIIYSVVVVVIAVVVFIAISNMG